LAAARSASMSAALSTNDWLTASTPCFSANSSRPRSWSVNALMPRSMPGRLRPLRNAVRRPRRLCSGHRCRDTLDLKPYQAVVENSRSPASPPGATAQSSSRPAARRDNVVAGQDEEAPPRSSIAPGRSSRAASSGRAGPPGSPRGGGARSAARMRAMRSAWSVKSPCEKLSRATFSRRG